MTDEHPSFAEIREWAHEIWERNHGPEGLDVEFWLVAERELRAERQRTTEGGEHGPRPTPPKES